MLLSVIWLIAENEVVRRDAAQKSKIKLMQRERWPKVIRQRMIFITTKNLLEKV